MRSSYGGSVTTPRVLARHTKRQLARSGKLYLNIERAALAARESPAATWEDPSTLCCPGEHLARGPFFPDRVPLDMLLLAATTVVVVPAKDEWTSGGRMAVVEVHPEPDRRAVDRRVRARSARDLEPSDWLRRRAHAVRDDTLGAGGTGVPAEVPKRTTDRHRGNRRCLRHRAVERRHRLRRSTAAIVAPDHAACGPDRSGHSRGSRGAVPCRCSSQRNGDAADEERFRCTSAPLCFLRPFRRARMRSKGGGYC